jgi:hypothetical protein
VIGLPKTGTSTLAVMLRMLNYKVTGPNVDFSKGDHERLKQMYLEYDGFQDYPWCFEWESFLEDPKAKFIVLKRDKESWYKSFYESYGGKEKKYLSYPYFEISKQPDTKNQFLEYFDAFYLQLDSYIKNQPDRFMEVSIDEFEWEQLCSFLNEELPKNILGKLVKKPHVNKNNIKTVKTLKYKILNYSKKNISYVIGKDNWVKLVIFLRKNNVV